MLDLVYAAGVKRGGTTPGISGLGEVADDGFLDLAPSRVVVAARSTRDLIGTPHYLDKAK
jgi:hypothetical protein